MDGDAYFHSTVVSFGLNLAILIMTTRPWFIINIDELYGRNLRGDEPLLKIQCFFDRFKFTGLVIEDPDLTSITVEMDETGDEFRSVSVDIKTCDWRWDPLGSDPTDSPDDKYTDYGNHCRQFYKDVKGNGPDGCIPSGLDGILMAQSWYEDVDGETCSVEFERRAGKGALAMSILGWIFCWVPFFPGFCMFGLAICVIPFGQNNMCGQQGDNTMHVALICLCIISAIGCFICSAMYVFRYHLDLERLERNSKKPIEAVMTNAVPEVGDLRN